MYPSSKGLVVVKLSPLLTFSWINKRSLSFLSYNKEKNKHPIIKYMDMSHFPHTSPFKRAPLTVPQA